MLEFPNTYLLATYAPNAGMNLKVRSSPRLLLTRWGGVNKCNRHWQTLDVKVSLPRSDCLAMRVPAAHPSEYRKSGTR
jgi:hypothetical protein